MKLNKILSFAALSLVMALAACSDDNKYVPGAQSPGAYFPDLNPASVQVSQFATSFDVPVMRTTVDSPSSYQIVAVDESGLFTIPSSVSFSEGSMETMLSIGYQPSDLELGTLYHITLSLADVSTEGTIYGPSTYEFDVKLEPSMEVHYKEFGTYIYDFFLNGYQPNIPVYQGHVEGTAETDSVVIVGGLPRSQEGDDKFVPWMAGFSSNPKQTLQFTVHYGEPIADGIYPLTCKPQGIGITTSNYGEAMIADIFSWAEDILYGEGNVNPDLRNYSYYDANRGRYTISAIYWGQDMEPGYIFVGGEVDEFVQLNGYPDYEIGMEFNGLYTAADFTQTYALIEVSSGEDVNQIKVAVGTGTANEIYNQMLNDEIYTAEAPGNATQEVRLPVVGSGVHRAVAIAYAAGEPVANSVISFQIGNGVTVDNDPNAWLSHGWADFTDGFIMPCIWYYRRKEASFAQYTVQQYIDMRLYQVEVQTLKENPNIIRIINPYGPDSGYPFEAFNDVNPNQKYNIVIDATDHDMVLVKPQDTGFYMRVTDDDGNGMALPGADKIYNYAGALVDENGYTLDEVKALYDRFKYLRPSFTENDGIGSIEIPYPYPCVDVFRRTVNTPHARLDFVLDPTNEKVAKFRQEQALRAVKAAPALPAFMYLQESDLRAEPFTISSRFINDHITR